MCKNACPDPTACSDGWLSRVESCCPGVCKKTLGDKVWKEIMCMGSANVKVVDDSSQIFTCGYVNQIPFLPKMSKLLTTIGGERIFPHCWQGEILCGNTHDTSKNCETIGWWMDGGGLDHRFHHRFRQCCPGLCGNNRGTLSAAEPFNPIYTSHSMGRAPASKEGCVGKDCAVKRDADGDRCWIKIYPAKSHEYGLRCSDIPKFSTVVALQVGVQSHMQIYDADCPVRKIGVNKVQGHCWRESYKACWPAYGNGRTGQNYAAMCCPHICGITDCGAAGHLPKDKAACTKHAGPEKKGTQWGIWQPGNHYGLYAVYNWSADALPPPAPPPMPSDEVCEQCYN